LGSSFQTFFSKKGVHSYTKQKPIGAVLYKFQNGEHQPITHFMTDYKCNLLNDFSRLWCALLLLLAIGVLLPQRVNATHAAGADLTYTSLGGLVYQVDATFYRDCNGTMEPGNVAISYKSALCGFTRTALANKIPNDNGSEITMPCATAPSTCNGGNSPGIRKWIYRAIITLPAACSDWIFSYRICCRNCTITTIQNPCASGSEIYIESALNNVVAPENNSPQFSNAPIAFVCLAQNFNYNSGVYDVDGDSISYELIAPKTSATTEVSYIAPASPQDPVISSTPFLMNAVTGDINFTASSLQISVMAIRINEFRNGVLIGSTIRDIQVYTQNCFNSIPVASGINGTSNFITTTCAGQQLCFTINTADADSNQTVNISVSNPITGSVISHIPGTRPGVQFCWTPGQNDISTNPRTFTVTVYDDACPFSGIQTFSYAVFVQGLTLTSSATNPTCFDGNNGSANVVVSGSGPFGYTWNTNPAQTTAQATGLHSGTYIVTVTDSFGCSTSSSANIFDPPISITANCVVTGMNSCQAGNSAAIQTNSTGGVVPYSYQWNTGATTASLQGVAAGTYTVTVTDALGCTAQANGNIQQGAGAVSATISTAANVMCYGQNSGSIQLAVTGGTLPYNFQWSNGSTIQNLTGIPAGNYQVTITDANGCSTSTSANVIQPFQPLQLVMTAIKDVSCYGGNDGSININVTGGTGAYQYIWSNGANVSAINNLFAGMYTVSVTDANGCSSMMSITINEPALPISVVPVSIVNVSCIPGSVGTIDISVNGGTAPFTYLWSNGSVTQDLINLPSGNYSVTVTDVNSCSQQSSFSIANHSANIVATQVNHQNVLCFNGTGGLIDLNVNGGQTPYSYLWSNGSTTELISGLQAGSYSVTITDANGCEAVFTYEILQPSSPLIPQIQILQTISCNEGTNGAFNLQLNGGTAPYSFLWSNGSTSQNPAGLAFGIYTVTVTDANGCNAIISQQLSQPNNPLLISLNSLTGSSCDSVSSVITSAVTGGVGPYNYLWSTGSTASQIPSSQAGLYSLTVTDSIGCVAFASIQSTGISNFLQISAIVSQPNCINGQTGSININVSGGVPGYSFSWSHGPSVPNVNGLAPGVYSVTITDSMGCFITKDFEIIDQTSVSIHLNGSSSICVGETVTLWIDTITGSTYQWYYAGIPLNGANTNSFTTPASGTYAVAVTNTCGTVMSNQVVIIVRSVENAVISNNQIICPPESAQLFASGGVTYEWTPTNNITFANVPDPIVNPTVSTTYSVTITNEFGCKTELKVEVGVVCDSLLVPNAFSPNGDGTNDGYVIDGIEKYPGNKLWVYNRWGNLVYKAKDYRNDWNGTSNISGIYMNKKVPAGTFYFILDLNDGSKPKSGYLIIRR